MSGYLKNPRFKITSSEMEAQIMEKHNGLTGHPDAIVHKINRRLIAQGVRVRVPSVPRFQGRPDAGWGK